MLWENSPPLPLSMSIGIEDVLYTGMVESAWGGVAGGYSALLVSVSYAGELATQAG